MLRKLGYPSFLVALSLVFAIQLANAQTVDMGRHARPRITHNIDESDLVTLKGNTHPEASQENDRGKVDDDFPMHHLLLQLRRSPEQEEAVQKYIDALHDPASPEYHKWLSADEFGERFGVADEDVDKVEHWLRSHGFKINVVYPSGMVIDFSGTAEQVSRTFGTEVHNVEVHGKKHTANLNDPQIPAALAAVVVGVVSLHDFKPRSMHVMRSTSPKFTFNGLYGTTYALVPADLATIYNLNPLFSAGYSGQGQTIALIEDTDVFRSADWSAFRSKLGLSSYTSGSFKTVHPASPTGPNNCAKPGVIAPNDAEAILDAEWASAAAPSAAVEIASCADTTTTFGGLIAIQNLLNSSNPPAIMSVSYGQCETVNGAAANAAYNSAYQQAVAEGVSVFVAAGDSGAAGCDNSVSAATHGVGANAFASTPYNVAVGGTDFSDTYSGANGIYWNSTNTSTFASATSYIPEIPWNNSCAGAFLSNYLGFGSTYGSSSLCNDPSYGPMTQTTVAGGGSPSACATGVPSIASVVSGTCKGWPKPSWQRILGNPNDGVRDTPDVSLFAADGLWSHYYVFCWSDTANGGAACTGDPSGWSGAGGTSFSAPILAGIQALVNQKMVARQGNPNPVYYQLAAAEYGSSGTSSCNSTLGRGVASSCVFYDVTQGDMDVNCTGNSNCYNPSGPGTQGVLSTSNNSFNPAYGTMTGWDFATGIGTLNATNLVNNWPTGGPVPGFFLSASPGSLSIAQSARGTSTISVTQLNGFSGSVSLAVSGLPSGVTASFNPTSTTSTSTLTLTASSTATTGMATVTITGSSGSLTNTTTISLTITAAPAPNFSLSASPNTLSIVQGANGTSTISVTQLNGFSGSVSLAASGLPSGVTAAFNPSSTTSTSTLKLTASGTATTGSATVTITGTFGSLTNTTTLALTVTAAPPPSTLPSVWTDADIGVTGLAGSANYANGTFTVNGAGTSAWSTADGVNFVYQPMSGDGSIVARVVSVNGNFTGGVMIRDSVNPNAMSMFVAYYSSRIYSNYRSITGGTTSQYSSGAMSLPYFVKLVRSGSTFSSYSSLDGVNWGQFGTSQTINMGQNVYVGLGVSSASTSTLATVTFDSVSVSSTAAPAPVITSVSATTGTTGSQVVISGTGFGASQGSSMVTLNGALTTINSWSNTSITITIPSAATSGPLVVSVAPSMNNSNPVTFTVTSQPLPAGWLDQDIGQVGVAGSATYANGTFTVKGAGTAVWSTADGFHFAYQPLSGDGTIVARVVSVSPSSEGGVMIRETLDASATELFTTFYPSNIYMNYRTSTGGSTSQAVGTSATLPYWVKVVRSGSTLSGYSSSDGVTWVQVGSSQTITMGQNVFIGLGVSSGNTSSPATATFDNVAVITSTSPNFALSASPSSLSVMQGASGSSTVSVTPLNGFNGSVSLSASGLPSGVTASFNPTSTTSPTNASTLTLTASSTAATTNSATVTITGTSGALTNSTTLSLTVTPAPVPNFSLSASPNTLSIVQGASGGSTISVTPQNGFSNSVSLSASGLPVGVIASFNPASTTSPTNSSSLTLTASSTATTGMATVTITGSSGSLTNTTTISLTITAAPAPNFSLSASPNTLSIMQGASGTSTISVTPVNGFGGSVGLSASGMPAGVTASFNPTSTTSPANSSTLTLTASSMATTTSSATVTITGTSGSLTNTTTLSLTVTAAPPPTALPSVWTDADIGVTGLAGSATYTNGTFTVNGAGTSAWSTADGINFVYQPMSGDGSIVARVLSVNGNFTGGVMIRDSLNPNAMSMFVAYYSSRIYSNYRTTTGGTTSQYSSGTMSLPYFVKLVRSGSTFSSYSSLDGVNWAQFGTSQTINMGQNVYVGLGVSSASTSTLATVTFDSVSVSSTAAPAPVITSVSATTGTTGSQVVISGTGFGASQGGSMVTLNGALTTINSWSDTSLTITIPSAATSGPLVVSVAPSMNNSNPVTFTVTSQPLPAGWLDQDIGQVGVAGSATYANGTFTVKGAGTAVWSTADGFHFAYQPLSGDGTIVARVVSVSPSSEGGVMIRETLDASATELFTTFYPSNIYMNYRTSTGGSTSQAVGGSATLPYWVKVVRSGSTLSGYSSSDGVTWVQVGSSQTITMGQNVFIGLGVSSGNTTSPATATFDNVTKTP